MNEPFPVKISAFPIYRFYRNRLPALTKVALAAIVLFGIFAFVIFSPGFTFEIAKNPVAPVASVSVSEDNAESGIFRDSEPLFLPTRWNFGTAEVPKELKFRKSSFETLFRKAPLVSPEIQFFYVQNAPRPEEVFGADAWAIARGFGAGEEFFEFPEATVPRKTIARIENADTGEVVFVGELYDITTEDRQRLLVPSEFICGIASGYGKPRVMAVRSCGDVERDKKIAESVARIIITLKPDVGMLRIFVD